MSDYDSERYEMFARVRRGLASDAARYSATEEYPRVFVVDLGVGEFGWNPASTTRDLVGPLRVRYLEFPDGGITADV